MNTHNALIFIYVCKLRTHVFVVYLWFHASHIYIIQTELNKIEWKRMAHLLFLLLVIFCQSFAHRLIWKLKKVDCYTHSESIAHLLYEWMKILKQIIIINTSRCNMHSWKVWLSAVAVNSSKVIARTFCWNRQPTDREQKTTEYWF